MHVHKEFKDAAKLYYQLYNNLQLPIYFQISMCDFGMTSSNTPGVIAPPKSLSSDLDLEVTNGIESSVLQGLDRTMAISVDQVIILYVGFSNSDSHFLNKVEWLSSTPVKV